MYINNFLQLDCFVGLQCPLVPVSKRRSAVFQAANQAGKWRQSFKVELPQPENLTSKQGACIYCMPMLKA